MRALATLMCLVVPLAASAQPAKDKPGCADPAGISRYEGALIFACRSSAFDTLRLVDRPIAAIGPRPRDESNSRAASGAVTGVAYVAPKGRSSTEVVANYRAALERAGFEIAFACDGDACGGIGFGATVTRPFGQGVPYELFSNLTDRHYLLAKLARAEGDVLASVFVSQNRGKVSWGEPASVLVEVVESKPMETGKVVVDAAALKGAIERDGRMALYGVYFDTGQAVLKPESGPQLAEIAALLRAQPALELLVVGHTDATGDLDANVALSQRRAQAVIAALQKDHAVDGQRLRAVGVGMAAPVAVNTSEQGRARNRRVEIVARVK